ncbi:MAG: response regulator [Myxococcales bacterium]|nr:response regulator [Myxococcales bacterium]
MKALVVDDSRAVRTILTRMLEAAGFEVAQAEHGRHALEVLARVGPPAIALLDWNMPEMNGYELLCAIRANGEYADTRVMMVTTENEMEQIGRALEAGADEYLMKPFDQEAMRDKLVLLGFEVPS